MPWQEQHVVIGESDEAERVVTVHGFSCAHGALLEVDDAAGALGGAPYSILSAAAYEFIPRRV